MKRWSAERLDGLREMFPEKFVSAEKALQDIRRGDSIFVGTGCGEPRHLLRALAGHAGRKREAFRGPGALRLWTTGVTPYGDERLIGGLRYDSFFVGESIRGAVGYSPVFLFRVPDLFRKKFIRVDVALVQVSPPDDNGYMSLGVSVDITRAAVDSADRVICQVNSRMPRVHGDTFIHVGEAAYLVVHDEPILEYVTEAPTGLVERVGGHVSRIVEDGDTIQIGYGSLPDAVLCGLEGKRHLGVHTELLGDGIVRLMKKGVVDNSRKTLDRGKTVASFCMGTGETYDFINDNPTVKFMPVDYTNDPRNIARQRNMTAINTALEIDLAGQSTSESFGGKIYGGTGGQADFMRGAALAPGGRSILALPSTTGDGERSSIVPSLERGAGVTLTRGDVRYVVTEYGAAYLHGRNVRERAMELIAIAHPKFREWLVEEAKRLNLIYADQAFVPGEEGVCPEGLERYRTTSDGLGILLRPVRISDEPLLKDFFYSLSDESNYRRFHTLVRYMPHRVLQGFVAIDYTRKMSVLALLKENGRETVVGVGQYAVKGDANIAEVAVAVRDRYQNRGIGRLLMNYMVDAGRREGLSGFSADVLSDNRGALALMRGLGLKAKEKINQSVCTVTLTFDE